jgi:hypothetical protein
VPVELVDPDAPVWHDREAFAEAAAKHGRSIPAADKFGGPGSHPENRRRSATFAWALAHGVTTTHGAGTVPLPDGPKLASMGLLDLEDRQVRPLAGGACRPRPS